MTLGAIGTHESRGRSRRTGIMQSFNLYQEIFFETWYNLIERYSSRDLTYDSDILPALSGVAKEFQRHAVPDPGRYLAGLWETDLISGLLWYNYFRVQEVPRRSQGDPLSSPPSWSWASISCHVRWDFQPRQTRAEVLDVSCNLRTADDKGMVTGGRLTLCGKLMPFIIQYTVDESFYTIHLMDEHREQWPGLASAMEQAFKSLFYPDVQLSYTDEYVPPGSVLYYLLVCVNDGGDEAGIVIRELPEGSKYAEERDAGKISPPLFARVGYFKSQHHGSLEDIWPQLEDTIVTIV